MSDVINVILRSPVCHVDIVKRVPLIKGIN